MAIAVALANKPQVMFADEPTGELDSATGDDVFEALRAANPDLGATVVIVTHDDEVVRQVQRTVAIRDGRTATEVVRRTDVDEYGVSQTVAEEYAMLDRAGRLQLPRDYRTSLGLEDRVRLELENDHIGVWPDGSVKKARRAARGGRGSGGRGSGGRGSRDRRSRRWSEVDAPVVEAPAASPSIYEQPPLRPAVIASAVAAQGVESHGRLPRPKQRPRPTPRRRTPTSPRSAPSWKAHRSLRPRSLARCRSSRFRQPRFLKKRRRPQRSTVPAPTRITSYAPQLDDLADGEPYAPRVAAPLVDDESADSAEPQQADDPYAPPTTQIEPTPASGLPRAPWLPKEDDDD